MPVIDEISVSVKNAELLRNIMILFSLIFFIRTSIWLSLFIYISCHDYHSLITLFLHRGDGLQMLSQ